MAIETAITFKRIFVALLLGILILVGVLVSVLDVVDADSFHKRSTNSDSVTEANSNSADAPYPGDLFNHIHWFIQVSCFLLFQF